MRASLLWAPGARCLPDRDIDGEGPAALVSYGLPIFASDIISAEQYFAPIKRAVPLKRISLSIGSLADRRVQPAIGGQHGCRFECNIFAREVGESTAGLAHDDRKRGDVEDVESDSMTTSREPRASRW